MRMYEQILDYKIRIPGMKTAFTLAEVLITLTIIGVIAALTIPALIQNIQDAQYHTAWRSVASDLSQASRRLATDNAGSLNGVFLNDVDMRSKYLNYLNKAKICPSDTCWDYKVYPLSGGNFTYWNLNTWKVIVLSNGVTIGFWLTSGNCTDSNSAKQNGCGIISIDVNGPQGPNYIGKDTYFGYATEDGSFEALGKQGDFWTKSNAFGCNPATAIGFTCSAQYLTQ